MEGINIINKIKGKRPAVVVLRDGKRRVYRAYSGSEQKLRDKACFHYKDGSTKPEKLSGKCGCKHCKAIMELPMLNWRIYGLCNECVRDYGKRITLDEVYMSYTDPDDPDGNIRFRWEEPGGKVDVREAQRLRIEPKRLFS